MAVYPLLSIKVSGIINERNFLNTKRQTISIIVQDRSVLMQGINHLNIGTYIPVYTIYFSCFNE